MNVLELFAGAGGGILGALILGHRPVCAVEVDPYCRRVLLERQEDGVLPPFPVWDDVRTFDGRPWTGRVDVVSGGFPCQDISSAGKRAGITGPKSGLWSEFSRIVREVRPRFVFVENSAALAIRGLDRVLGDLHLCGFDAEWDTFGACSVGAIHHRHRLFCVAKARLCFNANSDSKHVCALNGEVAIARSTSGSTHPHGQRCYDEPSGQLRTRRCIFASCSSCIADAIRPGSADDRWWNPEPEVARVAHGVAHGVDRNRALGNGQVPAVHAMAWRVLHQRLMGRTNGPYKGDECAACRSR